MRLSSRAENADPILIRPVNLTGGHRIGSSSIGSGGTVWTGWGGAGGDAVTVGRGFEGDAGEEAETTEGAGSSSPGRGVVAVAVTVSDVATEGGGESGSREDAARGGGVPVATDDGAVLVVGRMAGVAVWRGNK